MITKLLPYIFGSISFVGGLYLGLLSYRIYRPKFKTDEDSIKFDNWLKKFGTMGKILSIILIINGAYDLITRDPSRYQIGQVHTEKQWTQNDRDILISKCMQDALGIAEDYPEVAKEFCECSTDKVMSSLTYEEYIKAIKESDENRQNTFQPIIQECIAKSRQEIDSLNSLNNP